MNSEQTVNLNGGICNRREVEEPVSYSQLRELTSIKDLWVRIHCPATAGKQEEKREENRE